MCSACPPVLTLPMSSMQVRSMTWTSSLFLLTMYARSASEPLHLLLAVLLQPATTDNDAMTRNAGRRLIFSPPENMQRDGREAGLLAHGSTLARHLAPLPRRQPHQTMMTSGAVEEEYR